MFITNEDYKEIFEGLKIMQEIDNFIACEKPNYDIYVILRKNWVEILEIIENKLSD